MTIGQVATAVEECDPSQLMQLNANCDDYSFGSISTDGCSYTGNMSILISTIQGFTNDDQDPIKSKYSLEY